MKTDLTTYGSYLQSGPKASGPKAASSGKKDLKVIDPKLLKKEAAPDYKLDLSSKPTLPSMPDIPTPEISRPEVPTKEEKPEIKKPRKVDVEKVKEGSQKKPMVIFIKGLDMFSSPSKSETGYAGVGKMAEAVEGSRIYGWDQHDEIIEEIKKVHRDYPVILVGHSLGGDTAVEVADALDSLDHQFRKVDLLITMDAVGFNNDIIPQNVKNHLNVFGENDFFLNDGPHVARRNEMTKVKNILSPHDHTELDDDREIQYEVVSLIQETLSRKA